MADDFHINALKFKNVKNLNFIDDNYAKFLALNIVDETFGYVDPKEFISNIFVAGDRVTIKPIKISGLNKYQISADYNSSDEQYLARIDGELKRIVDPYKTTIF